MGVGGGEQRPGARARARAHVRYLCLYICWYVLVYSCVPGLHTRFPRINKPHENPGWGLLIYAYPLGGPGF